LKNKTVKLEGILSFSLSINKIKQQLTKKHLCCENKEQQKTPSVWFFNSNNLLRKQITFIIRQKECKKSFLDHIINTSQKNAQFVYQKMHLVSFFQQFFQHLEVTVYYSFPYVIIEKTTISNYWEKQYVKTCNHHFPIIHVPGFTL